MAGLKRSHSMHINESAHLQEAIIRYYERTGSYPERVLVDQIYRIRANRNFCKDHGIRISGPKLGRPGKPEQAITSMGFAMKIQTFLTMPQNGMLQGMQPLLGYNYSNGKTERVNETLKKAVIMSFVYGLFLAGAAICFGDRLLAIFTSNEAMVKFGSTCLIFITVTAALKSCCPLITTFYQAIGNARNALIIIAVSMIIKVLTIVTMANGWRTEGILWSFVITDILTFMFTAVFLIISSKKKGCR